MDEASIKLAAAKIVKAVPGRRTPRKENKPPYTREELDAALQIAGPLLVEADHVDREAQAEARLTRERRRRCEEDVETLLKALCDLDGERGQKTVWLEAPHVPPSIWGAADLPRFRISVTISGHKVSQTEVVEVYRRLRGEKSIAVEVAMIER